MKTGMLEHVNLTVSDPRATATRLCELFGWRIRWEGPAKGGGFTVHVGTESQYLAVYARGDADATDSAHAVPEAIGGLNHVGVRVDDLDAIEAKVVAAGFEPMNHADYDPGRRFYFLDGDGIEFEIVSYA